MSWTLSFFGRTLVLAGLIWITQALNIGSLEIDEASCSHPSPDYPELNLDTIKEVISEAVAIALNAEKLMINAESSSSSDSGKRIRHIVKLMLASDVNSEYWHEAKNNYENVVKVRKFPLQVHCNEDIIDELNEEGEFPDHIKKHCDTRYDPDGTVHTNSAYALLPDWFVICPVIWRFDFNDPTSKRGLTVGNMRRNNFNGVHADSFRPVSFFVLHELLHLSSFGFSNAKGMSVGVVDVEMKTPHITFPGYGFERCRAMAVYDTEAQQRGLTVPPLSSRLKLSGTGHTANADMAGISIWNADSLTFAAFMMYSINTDFVTTGIGTNFQSGGFKLPERICQVG